MENTTNQDFELFKSIDLQKLSGLFIRFWWMILLSFVLGGVLVYFFCLFQTPIYEAKTQVMVTRSTGQNTVADVTQSLNAQQLAETYVELLSQQWVRDQVAAKVGGEVDENQIRVSAAENTMVINIWAQDPDPARAAKIADTLVQVLIAQNNTIQSGRYTEAEQGFNLQIEQIRNQIAEVQGKLNLLHMDASKQDKSDLLAKINQTSVDVDALKVEIAKYQAYAGVPVAARLDENQNRMLELREQLGILEPQRQQISDQIQVITANGQPQTDLSLLESQLAERDAQIKQVKADLDFLQSETGFLAPFAAEGSLNQTIVAKQNSLAQLEEQLVSFQKAYTELTEQLENRQTPPGTSAELETDLAMYQELYISLVNKREEVRLQKMQNMPNVIQVNPALTDEIPVQPRTLRNTALGAAAGLMMAILVIFLLDYFDNTLKTQEEVERLLKLPILGYISRIHRDDLKKDGFYTFNMPRSPVTEAFRSLRTNLEYLGVDRPLKSLLVSSPSASEGKTTIAANLAAVIAQSGKKVVIVDADLRRPRLHDEIGLPNRIGLSTVFRSAVPLETVIQSWPGTSLSVITGGTIPPNPAELLGSAKMAQILDQLEAQFDMVIIDSPPTIVTDSQLIAARTDGVLLVLVPGKTVADLGRIAVEQYRRVGARLLGAILNNMQPGHTYGGYGYYSSKDRYYQYNENLEEAEKSGKQKQPKERKPDQPQSQPPAQKQAQMPAAQTSPAQGD